MPDFPIVDSHVHLYDVGRLPYRWLESRPRLNRPHLIEDFDRARAAVEGFRTNDNTIDRAPVRLGPEGFWDGEFGCGGRI